MSFRDIENELSELYDNLDEVDDLDAYDLDNGSDSQIKSNTNRRNEDSRYKNSLLTDIDKYKNEAMEAKSMVLTLKGRVSQIFKENKDLKAERLHLYDQLNTQNITLEHHKRRLTNVTRSTEDAKKKLRDESGHQYELEQENQRLREAIKELEENERDLVSEIEIISNERYTEGEHLRAVEATTTSLKSDLEDKISCCVDYEEHITEMKILHQHEIHSKKEWEVKWEKDNDAHKIEVDKLQGSLEKMRITIWHQSNDTTSRKKLDKDLESLQTEVIRLKIQLSKSQEGNEQIENDLKDAILALHTVREDCNEKIKKMNEGKQKEVDMIQIKLGASLSKNTELRSRCNELEEQLSNLEEKLNRSEEKNIRYEKGHGLQEPMKLQKKLEADIRRRDKDMQGLNIELGMEMDKCNVLRKTCEMMRENIGTENIDFIFQEKDIRKAMVGEKMKLETKISDLHEQIDNLKNERLQYMRKHRRKSNDIDRTASLSSITNPREGLIDDSDKRKAIDQENGKMKREIVELKEQIDSLENERIHYMRKLQSNLSEGDGTMRRDLTDSELIKRNNNVTNLREEIIQDSDIRMVMDDEKKKMEGQITEMKEQIDRLENERIHYMIKVRRNSNSDDITNSLLRGLTESELTKVSNYVANLSDGNVDDLDIREAERMKKLISELMLQIDNLENEQINYRRNARRNSNSSDLSNSMLLGLTESEIIEVNHYVTNIRKGIFGDSNIRKTVDKGKERMERQINELMLQVENLENERMHYMRMVRRNSGTEDLKTSILRGLSESELIKLKFYVTNIRKGIAEDTDDSSLAEKIGKLESELSLLRLESEQDKILIDSLTFKLAALKRHTSEVEKVQDHLQQKDKLSLVTDCTTNAIFTPYMRRKVEEITGQAIDNSLSPKANHYLVALITSYEKLERDLQKQNENRIIFKDITNEQKINKNNQVGKDSPEMKDIETQVSLKAIDDMKGSSVKTDIENVQLRRRLVQAEENKKLVESEAKRYREQYKALLQELILQEDVTSSFLDNNFTERIDMLQHNNNDVDRVVEFAQTTVQNLKQILEKKNDLVQSYQARFLNNAENSSNNVKEMRKKDISEITVHNYDENIYEIEKMKHELLQDSSQTNNSRVINLFDQLGEASDLINAKEALIDQLQFSLRSAEEFKNDAENRCQVAMEEIEKMKRDMVTLATNLKDGDMVSVNENFESIETFGSLQQEIKWKDEKIRRLHLSIKGGKKKKSHQSNKVGSITTKANEMKDLDKANEKNKKLSEDMNGLKRDIASMRLQIRKLQQALEESKSKESVALVITSNLEKDVKSIRQTLREATTEKEKVTLKIKHIKSKWKNMEQSSDESKKTENEVLELQTRISTLVKQNTLLRGSIAQKKLKSEQDAVGRVMKKSNRDDKISSSIEALNRVKKLEKKLVAEKQTDKKKKEDIALEPQVKEVSNLRQQISDCMTELNFIKKEKKEVLKKSHSHETNTTVHEEIKRLKNENDLLSSRINTKDSYQVDEKEKANVEELINEILNLKRNIIIVKSENEKIKIESKEIKKLPSSDDIQLRKELCDVRVENSRLVQDLQAFDLNFFEEIEDLKFKYNEEIKTK